MRLFVGTSGYSYKEWKGRFYPEELPGAQMLRFYAERFPSVEINNTFYQMPKKEVLASWAADVGPDFRFVLKASRRITHIKRLKDAGGELEYLLASARTLGERLGPILFQLPPNLKKDAERLRAFLGLLPGDVRAAFEFRHGSWLDDEIQALLRAHPAALVLADGEGEDEEQTGEGAPPPALVPTADFGYLRLRRCDYGPEALGGWVDRIRAQPWQEAWVFFKHEDGATGPRFAQDFAAAFAARAGA